MVHLDPGAADLLGDRLRDLLGGIPSSWHYATSTLVMIALLCRGPAGTAGRGRASAPRTPPPPPSRAACRAPKQKTPPGIFPGTTSRPPRTTPPTPPTHPP